MVYTTSSSSNSSGAGACAAPSVQFTSTDINCAEESLSNRLGMVSAAFFPHCPERFGLTDGEALWTICCDEQGIDGISFTPQNETVQDTAGCAGETTEIIKTENTEIMVKVKEYHHDAMDWSQLSSAQDQLASTAIANLRVAKSLVGVNRKAYRGVLVLYGNKAGDPFVMFPSVEPGVSTGSQVTFNQELRFYEIKMKGYTMSMESFMWGDEELDLSSYGAFKMLSGTIV
jgi:hypothetical protein